MEHIFVRELRDAQNVLDGIYVSVATISVDENGTNVDTGSRWGYDRYRETSDALTLSPNRPFAFMISYRNHIISMGKMNG